MSWFTSLFSSGATALVKEVGGVIDNLHTSGSEKAQAKLELTRVIQGFKSEVLQAQAKYDQEITKRWQSDNEHFITRLVRPLSMVFILFLFAIVVLFDGNIGTFSINESYIPVIEGLLYTVIIAYFGGRSGEKVFKTVNNKKNTKPEPDNRTPLQRNYDDME